MKRLGIRDRILLAALAPAILVAVLVTGMLTSEHLQQASVEQHRRLAALARQLAASAEYGLFVGNREMLARLLDAALAEPDVKAAAFLDPHGKPLAATVPPNKLPAAGETLHEISAPATAEPLVHWHVFDIRPNHYAEDDLFDSGDTPRALPLGRLLLKVSNQSLRDDARDYALKAGGIAALTLTFGIMLALGLAHGLIRTLGEISRVVAGIARGRHELRVDHLASGEQGELGELAQGINAMAAAVGQTQAELTRRVEEATATLRAERDAAERASRARSRFFAAASHDLRQPVQALALFVERLRRDVKESALSPKVEQVARSVQTLQTLLDTLLDYSRLDGQVYRIEARPVRAAVAIDAVIDECAPLAAEKKLALRQRIRDCWLATDPVLLHRILLNLVGNAIRHTRQGGVLIACRHRGGQARIEVWDTGPGIAPEHQEAIFEELVQLNNPERDANKGLGLGLAIVRRIADLLGHPIEVRSRVGRGSCFAVTIPITAAPPESLAPHDLPSDEPGQPILVVGAATPERDALVELLDSWGRAQIHALEAADAQRWVAARGAPALVLCDTAGNLEGAEALLDRLDAIASASLPALLIHPGPLKPGAVRGRRRLLLPRPFRPARLRALIDHLLEPEEATAADC